MLFSKNKGWMNIFTFLIFLAANCSSFCLSRLYFTHNISGSRVEGHRSLEPVLPEQNDAVPVPSLPVAGACADPAEALPGAETTVSVSAGSKRKLEEE